MQDTKFIGLDVHEAAISWLLHRENLAGRFATGARSRIGSTGAVT